jgi:hypothetical protein
MIATSRKLNYLIDLHGVIDSNPEYFKFFTEDLIKCGHSVFICTGAKYIDAFDKLISFKFKKNVNFNKILSISDVLSNTLPAAEIETDINGNIWVDDMLWWPMKGKFCKEYNIDVIIDDSEEYFVYVPKHVVKLHLHITKN